MQTKTTLSYYSTPIRMTKMKKMTSVGKNMGEQIKIPNLTVLSSHLILSYFPKRNERMCVYRCFLCHSPKLQTAQVCQQVEKQTVAYPHERQT
jgi:hypothetical protein